MTCPCSTAPMQLLARGLFPCAPIAPTLAVDLRVLNFGKLLFVRTSPNMTAWCDTLETFLSNLGHKLTTKDSLRHRFSNAYHWYSVLVTKADQCIANKIGDCRACLYGPELPQEADQPVNSNEQVAQPSQYLYSRCLLCFGGTNWRNCRDLNTKTDIIVCLDVCFTQKHSAAHRGSAARDPPNPTTSFFIPEEDVKAMEDHVQECRSTNRGRPSQRRPQDDAEDRIEEGMKIPNSVLDGCNKSFVAADEKKEKASTRFFADTGLMALLCRHDRVLWLVNMTSAGEKQHYALTLIRRLFNHIPVDICRLWDFLPSAIDRIVFAISVFHAYGHQWACQIIYHPRKREYFGLSDGEGCERLWSSLKMLIPSLRVSGYHQRLFVLDMQVRYLDNQSLEGLGQWLSRRWTHCQQKRSAAEKALRGLFVVEEDLRREWQDQIKCQTKKAARQSKRKGEEAVAVVLALQQTVEARQASVDHLDQQLVEHRVDNIAELIMQLLAARLRLEQAQVSLRRKISALGVHEKANLAALKKSAYLRVRMNARALKTRIRNRLRDRKFEIEKLERSYRQTVNVQA
ncbi:hypothetical protein BJ138DRAFT_1231768 [Hygrophoropsis aurantiaca]|uniref:Uncharacterized protein n=1 Tax=Hygrophoropsis aurantiaca TaxID=72124 RepID=A0ACB7ZVH0_9AGAM|nr:hypothetical protein BJ138DRAFT_1231768 [Hygrophoropsis aurantiaca]